MVKLIFFEIKKRVQSLRLSFIGVGGRLTLESAVSGTYSIACQGVPVFEGFMIFGEITNFF